MVNIGSKVKQPSGKDYTILQEIGDQSRSHEAKPRRSELTDGEKIDLLECCYTWQSAYKKQCWQPKTQRMWDRVEAIIKKLTS